MKRVAAESGRSVNAYASAVLAAAVDPAFAPGESERLRERLAQAGLLTASGAVEPGGLDPAAVERARKRAGRGVPLSDLVTEDRG